MNDANYVSRQGMLDIVKRARTEEREMALRVLEAEREWGSDLVEAYDRIKAGLGPRKIPGWNAPSEE